MVCLILYKINSECLNLDVKVKSDLFDLINVPARHQVWLGWPDAVDDDSVSRLISICTKTWILACVLKSDIAYNIFTTWTDF